MSNVRTPSKSSLLSLGKGNECVENMLFLKALIGIYLPSKISFNPMKIGPFKTGHGCSNMSFKNETCHSYTLPKEKKYRSRYPCF